MEDLFGIKPIANTVEKTADHLLKGIEGFCSRVFSPALTEIGLSYGDRAEAWRTKNLIKILKKSEGKLIYSQEKLTVHPKVLLEITENGSLSEEDEMQEMWAGLLAASCSDQKSDENLIFVNLLKKLTVTQANILKYACENSKKIIYQNGLIGPEGDLKISRDNLIEITGINDIHRLDRELDYLRSMELITCGFVIGNDLDADLTPTSLALNFFIRLSGSKDSPEYFWKNSIRVVGGDYPRKTDFATPS